MMKQIPMLLLLGFALSFCGLTDKLKSMKNSNSNSGPTSSGSSSNDGITAEKAEPTAAQTAALAGGSSLSWDQQGMSWSLPPTWTKASDERNILVAQSPGGENAGHLIVSISPMSADFPITAGIKASYDGAQTRKLNGEVDQVRWLEIGGVKGVEFRESNPNKPDGIRRLQWMAYRKYNGQVQLVNVMLSSSGQGFPGHEDAMRGVLYSTKLSH